MFWLGRERGGAGIVSLDVRDNVIKAAEAEIGQATLQFGNLAGLGQGLRRIFGACSELRHFDRKPSGLAMMFVGGRGRRLCKSREIPRRSALIKELCCRVTKE